MTDRELLDKAAKAAGISLQKKFVVENQVAKTTDGKLWAPLIDDGDALRLAVKLDLFIDAKSCCAMLPNSTGSEPHDWLGGNPDDPYVGGYPDDGKEAAMRLAIVRAAAALAG